MTRGSGELPAGARGGGTKITPLDIQQKEFRVSRFGGYRMRDVDEFLDRLTEVVSEIVEENARLRRQTGAAAVVGSPDLADVARQADEIIQRARDEAARIDADAQARSATPGMPAAGSEEDRAAVKAFLQQEREFLQDLAGLVQGHAETVKGMAKNARRADVAQTESTDAPASEAPVDAPPPPPIAEEHDVAEEGGSGDEDRTERVIEIDDAATQSLPAAEESSELAQARPAGGAAQDRGGEGDPSLRDLFWGEDG